MEVQSLENYVGANVVKSPSGLEYVTGNPSAVNQAIEQANPVQVLRNELTQAEENKNRPLMERARERGEAKRKERTHGFGEFWKKLKNSVVGTIDTSVGLAGIGTEAVGAGIDKIKDPNWREAQLDKVDNKIAEARERARLSAEKSRQDFDAAVQRAVDRADKWMEEKANAIDAKAAKLAKDGANLVGREFVAPLLTKVVEPAVKIIDKADLEVTRLTTESMDRVGGLVGGFGEKAWDRLENSASGNALAAAAEQFRKQSADKKGIGKLVTDIDNAVEKCRSVFEKMFGFGKKMRREANSLRADFKTRHEDNVAAAKSLNNAADQLKQGLV